MGGGCVVFTKTIAMLCCAMLAVLLRPRSVVALCCCGPDRQWRCVVVAQIGGGFWLWCFAVAWVYGFDSVEIWVWGLVLCFGD